MPAIAQRASRPLTATRQFGAPRKLVFDTLTTSEHLQRWMTPPGFEPVDGHLDLREGGSFQYGIAIPGCPPLWGRWTFHEIVRPERVVMVVQFSDQSGGLVRNPMSPFWPLHTLSTTTLSKAGKGQTTMAQQWQALDASAVEVQVFEASHAGMEIGWNATLDRLAAYLDELQDKR